MDELLRFTRERLVGGGSFIGLASLVDGRGGVNG